MADIPIVVTAAGAQPTAPATLLAQLVAIATGLSPGITTDLPGSLIEDVTSTQAAGLSLIDQARVDLVNSLTPFGANLFLLQQLGNIYLGDGAPNPAANTTVSVVFTAAASPGAVIAQGFIVSDGTNQYVVQDGGIIGTGGSSLPLTAVAIVPGSFAVPANTVTQLVTSAPSGINLSVNNPQAGTPGAITETESDYRARILQAGRASAQGMGNFLKTQLRQVPGVQARLVSVRSANGGWEVICGGYQDQYQVAYAIWQALFDVSLLAGSSINVTGITKAIAAPTTPGLTANTSGGSLPSETVYVKTTYVAAEGETQGSPQGSTAVTGPNAQVVVASPSAATGATGYNIYASNTGTSWLLQNATPIAIGTNFNIDSLVTGTAAAPTANTTGIYTTNLYHGYTTGQSVTVSGAAPSAYNGTFTVTIFSPTTFSTGIDTSADAAWTSGGVCTPNTRNISVTISDYPDSYIIPFVNPPQETVAITCTWNTNLTNFVGAGAVAQLAQPALVAYVNSVGVGQPLLVYQLEAAFTAAVASILPPYAITRLVFAVSINGAGVSPPNGEGTISGDPESFFFCTTANITVAQG